jgi:hypothetical protein
MDSEPQDEHPVKSWGPTVLLALVVLIALVAVGGWLWQRYDPFFVQRPAVRDAKALLDSARQRPLTDEEFEAAVGLLGADTPFARTSAVTALELEAGRSPQRKQRVIAALTEHQQAADPAFRQAVGQALGRLQPVQQGP